MISKALNEFCLVLMLIFAPSLLLAKPAILINFNGRVDVSVNETADWQPAVIRMKIDEGGSIKTYENSGALILMPNKTRIWMRENSALEIEQKKTLSSRLNFLFGKLKIRVPHLLRGELFKVRTPAAVCAVMGTEFAISLGEEGKTDIYVLYGEVKMRYNIPPPSGNEEILLPQGHAFHIEEMGKEGVHKIMTRAEELAGIENWNPGLNEKERREPIKRKETERMKMRQFAKSTRQTNKNISSFAYKVKESDLEAGRTLKDIHGNLVRVDQRLMRPDGKTLQFFNLVKRPVYNYSTPNIGEKFEYKGNQGITNRLDLMQINMVFNQDIPERMEEWAGFFDKGAVKAEKAAFIAANRTDPDNIFFVAEYYLRDESRDELVNNARVIFPDMTLAQSYSDDADRDVLITGIVNKDDFLKIANVDSSISGFRIEDNNDANGSIREKNGAKIGGAVWGIKISPNGLSYLQSQNILKNSDTSWEKDTTGDDRLYNFQADAYWIGGVNQDGTLNTSQDPPDVFWLTRENYGITNCGKLADVSDFTDTGKDPFSLMKEHAVESIVHVKNDASGSDTRTSICTSDYSPDGVSHNGENNNIDLVLIPDLPVAAVQRMLPAVDKLSN